jgi:hypothetical protein
MTRSGCARGASAGSPTAGVAQRAAVPILATGHVERALAHDAALGFETEAWEGGYGFVSGDRVELHLRDREGFDPSTNTVSCYLHVRDADALYAEWAAAGVDGKLVAPFDTDYGLREGSHVDPDGNVIRSGSPIAEPAADLCRRSGGQGRHERGPGR